MRLTLILLLSGSTLLPVAMHAQSGRYPAAPSVFAGYSILRTNTGPGQCGCFTLNGGIAELAVPLRRRLSVIAGLSGQTTSNANGSGVGLSLITATAGPRWTFGPAQGGYRGRFSPFAEAQAGFTHGFNSSFPGTALSSSANAFTVAAGGGLDVRLARRISIRPAQIDYVFTNFANGTNGRENSLRGDAGIVLRF